MINKSLARILLRIAQSPSGETDFTKSTALLQFVTATGIGIPKGSRILFNEKHKDRIRAWLKSDNIDPETPVDAWSDLGRAESLAIGPDEKWAGEAVRAQRIAFKALSGKPLLIGDAPIYLPLCSNLEWRCAEAVRTLRHDAVIVVENWEVFERVDDLQLDMTRVSANPLILWRGGTASTSVGAAMRFIEDFARPVWSAPDYDPEGLAIAARLPHLAGVLAPPDDVLRELLGSSRLHARYSQQLPGAQSTLEQASHPDVKRLWTIVRQTGKALPQERLCMQG
ncbi:DUF7281 domain-containing protein [Paraburkholderia strydomiana]|uniref:DUF7281 domain-containing protein n=1 Tax=Paraburkholderia strydomiana TaxID=1245417 RepID=UPI0038BD8EB9